MRPAAPGSLTGEIARMLEIERQNNREPADASAGSNGPSGSAGSAGSAGSDSAGEHGSSGRGLLRRARRAVVRPAGPPAAAEPPSTGAGSAAAEPPAAGAGSAGAGAPSP